MKLAVQLIRKGLSLSRTAEQVGYQSDAAFSRAFKKVTGTLPGALRRDGGQPPGWLRELCAARRLSKKTRRLRIEPDVCAPENACNTFLGRVRSNQT